MTTDITELAQSLKAAAENAIGAHERLAAYPYGEIIDISQHEGEQIDIDITDLNEFNKEANPVNILALVEALEKAQQENTAGVAGVVESYETTISMLKSRIAELESRTVTVKLPPKIERDDADGWFTYKGGRVGGGAAEWYNKALDDVGAALSAVVIVKPEDADGIREKGNQFLVVRHPGKVPVIKHPVGELEDYLRQILKADPLATIDIVTHRYYGVGGQFVEDADEYLHEMSIKVEAE
ncbi:ead/Ea22-like family protein [Klebsiella pneumoniae]|uniref:ead/Ea22-like family protein n=1 Tax=Klebsiella pneumoniae TaxID=573 RepID=UPI000CD163B3|nr:ead/Ea22-like family protein [Klebsiella pneumoniae]AUU95675.1 hypothetical protein C2U49_13125 [Klebsiella pneumoniae]MCI8216809.1 hypothetical protein [Klebsiella pneumoniae]POW76894.1 hypothetical protein C3413_22365 [Klebsiella pneumoniae]HDK6015130.1 hypothetical protein [Klebsiella pneumoniae]